MNQIDIRKFLSISGKAGRYPVIDAVRAIAIILVLFRHWSEAAQQNFSDNFPSFLHTLASNGWIGVDLFFLLSGFLIASHFVNLRNLPLSIASVKEFYFRRAFRTMPLYWAIICLCWLISALQGEPRYSPLSFMTHFLFLQDYIGSDVLVTLWSLAVEEKFYLLAPGLGILLFQCGRKWCLYLIGATMVLIFFSMVFSVGNQEIHNYPDFFWTVRAPFHHSVLGILAGLVLAISYQSFSDKIYPINSLKTYFFIFVFCSALLHSTHIWLNEANWLHVVYVIGISIALFSGILFLGLLINQQQADFGAQIPLRNIAKLSYALYLVHFPIIPFAIAFTKQLGTFQITNNIPMEILFLCIYLGFSYAFSVLLHFMVEKPFLLLRDHLVTSKNRR